MLEYWIIFIQVVSLLVLGIVAYNLANIMIWKDDFDKKMSRKIKGVSKKDQKNIDKVKSALEKDFEKAIGSIDFNQDVKELDGLDNFSQLLQNNPDVASSGLASFGLMDIIAPLLKLTSGGEGEGGLNLLSMLNTENAKNAAVAGIAFKVVQKFLNRDKKDIPSEYLTEKNSVNKKKDIKYVKSEW